MQVCNILVFECFPIFRSEKYVTGKKLNEAQIKIGVNIKKKVWKN